MERERFLYSREQFARALISMALGVLCGGYTPSAISMAAKRIPSILPATHQSLFIALLVVLAIALFVTESLTHWKRFSRAIKVGFIEPYVCLSFSTGYLGYLLLNSGRLHLALLVGVVGIISLWVADDKSQESLSQTFPTDRLSRSPFISALLRAIQDGGRSVIAITGDYGAGKTWILHQVENELRAQSSYIVVYIKSWLPNSSDHLVETFVSNIGISIRSQYAFSDAPRKLRAYGALLVKAMPKGLNRIADLVDASTQSQQTEDLRRALLKLDHKVIVLVDEVDRLNVEELKALFKLLKGVDDLPNIVFVCAFHKEGVVKALGGNEEFQYSYIEKFFPFQMPLPSLDSVILGEELARRIERIRSELGILSSDEEIGAFYERVGPVWRTCLVHRVDNIRRLDLFIEGLQVFLASLRNEVDAGDAFILQGLRFVAPAAYECVERHAFQLANSENSVLYSEQLPYDAEQRSELRKKIRTKILESAPMNAEIVEMLVNELFPQFALAGGRNHPRVGTPTRRNSRRIFDAERTGTYFSMSVSNDRLTAATEDRILSALGTSTPDVAERILKLELLSFDNDSVKADFYQVLLNATDMFEADTLTAICSGLTKRNVKYRPYDLGTNEVAMVRNVVFKIGGKIQELRGEGTAVLVAAIRDSVEIALATDIFFYTSHTDRSPSLAHWCHAIDQEAIKNTFIARLEIFKSDFESLFALSRETALNVLHRWTEADPVECRALIDSGLQRSPDLLGKFILWMRFSGNFGQNWEGVDRFIEKSRLCQILDPLLARSSHQWSHDESTSIQDFVDRHCQGAAEGRVTHTAT